jgi:hypothetical protein
MWVYHTPQGTRAHVRREWSPMAENAADQAQRSELTAPIQEIDVLWLNAGLSCDGDP